MALPELHEAEELFKGSVWDTLVDFGLSALFAEIPFLGLPVIRDLIKWVIHKFTNTLYTALTEILDLKYVVLKNLGLQKKFTEIALRLKGIAIEHGIDSEEFKNAREEHKKALAAKVRSLLINSADGMLARADKELQGMRGRGGVPSWHGLRRVELWENLRDGLSGNDRLA